MKKQVEKRRKRGGKRSFLDWKRVKNGVRSKNFILTQTEECGFEVGVFGDLFFKTTEM